MDDIFRNGDFAILEYGDGSPLEECMVLERETVPGMGLHYRVDVRGEGIIRWVPAHALRKLEATDILEGISFANKQIDDTAPNA